MGMQADRFNRELQEGRRRLAPKNPRPHVHISIPEIIHGSYKEGFEILWEIESYDYDRLKVTIELDSIPEFWREPVQVYLAYEMKKHYPEVDVEYT